MNFSTAYEKRAASLPGQTQPAVKLWRDTAFKQFEQLGLPTQKNEEWKYTSLKPLTQVPFELAPAQKWRADWTSFRSEVDSYCLFFVDGRCVREALPSFPKGLEVGFLSDLLENRFSEIQPYLPELNEPFAQLNSAFLNDGVFLKAHKNTQVDKPIQLVFLSTTTPQPKICHPRTIVVAEEGSALSVIETYRSLETPSEAPSLTNAQQSFFVGKNAQVDWYYRQLEHPEKTILSRTDVTLLRDSRWNAHVLAKGAKLGRQDINVSMQDQGAQCFVSGLYLAKGNQHLDNRTFIEHDQPHGTSRQFLKGIVDDTASAVFNGKVLVKKGAQKSDAEQSNKNLLLTKDAVVNAKPQLEIYADDVKCAHGATMGQLDERAIYYLRSRGVPTSEARRLLTQAFGSEVFESIASPDLRSLFLDPLNEWLTNGAHG